MNVSKLSTSALEDMRQTALGYLGEPISTEQVKIYEKYLKAIDKELKSRGETKLEFQVFSKPIPIPKRNSGKSVSLPYYTSARNELRNQIKLS